jgi:hypothetical protein
MKKYVDEEYFRQLGYNEVMPVPLPTTLCIPPVSSILFHCKRHHLAQKVDNKEMQDNATENKVRECPDKN